MSESIATAAQLLAAGQRLLDEGLSALRPRLEKEGRLSAQQMDQWQLPLYELAHLTTQLEAARQVVAHATNVGASPAPASQLVVELAALYAAEMLRTLHHGLAFREEVFALSPDRITAYFTQPQLVRYVQKWSKHAAARRAAELIEQTNGPGEDGFDAEHEALQTVFRRYARDKIAPLAERIHREDQLLPDEQIDELAEMGCFGLSIPTQYGGFQDEANPDYLALVIVSDELSRASFGTAGSLGTRPELLSKALLKGGTASQKQKWLPLIASGKKQTAVAITEPDYGSDVAHLTMTARRVPGGWRLNGRKMWSTFAGRAEILMVLARTDPDAGKAHRGLTLFIVEKPAAYGQTFSHEENGGRISGRAIPTIGYRGMHSFDVVFDDYFVPDENVIGGEAGLGQGFYLQMHGFGGSRLQTAGRALGVMAAAFHAALDYACERQVFGQRLLDFPLTRHKLTRMAAHIQAARRLTYDAARQMEQGHGDVAAAMAKLQTARSAEWITREAQQLHGGMGYAEEFPISRHFVDARVLAIFEGAEEVLALRVIARQLLAQARSG